MVSYNKDYSDLYGKEVFIIGKEESSGDEVYIYKAYEELLDKIKTLSMSTSPDDYTIIHGVLAPANVLPEHILDTKVYIIAFDPYCIDGEGSIIQTSDDLSISELAEEIEDVVINEQNVEHSTHISSTYLVYGYQLNMCYSINDDDISEATISMAEHVVKEVELIARTQGKGFKVGVDIEHEKAKGAI